jgi:hypothetical protein
LICNFSWLVSYVIDNTGNWSIIMTFNRTDDNNKQGYQKVSKNIIILSNILYAVWKVQRCQRRNQRDVNLCLKNYLLVLLTDTQFCNVELSSLKEIKHAAMDFFLQKEVRLWISLASISWIKQFQIMTCDSDIKAGLYNEKKIHLSLIILFDSDHRYSWKTIL